MTRPRAENAHQRVTYNPADSAGDLSETYALVVGPIITPNAPANSWRTTKNRKELWIVYSAKTTLMHSTPMAMSEGGSVRSLTLPHTHSKRNIPNANTAANAAQSTILIPNASTYNGITGPVIEIENVAFQNSRVR
jgi:hypothetical protein